MNFRGALSWLGLIADNDAYQPQKASYPGSQEEEYSESNLELEDQSEPAIQSEAQVSVVPESVAPVVAKKNPVVSPAVPTAQAVPQLVADIAKIVNLKPRSYAESARIVGENFREGAPVIINLAEMDDLEAKQLLAFAGGLTFALSGKLERINKMVFVLSPSSIMIANSDKQRIADGFYNQN